MALDPVPWVIGDVAEHGPDVARQLAYLASGGREGVVAPGDLKVSALPVPGAGAQVAAGGGSILNRTATQQAYTARNPNADLTSVKFAATGSSAGRSDLVVLVVDNPYIDGNAQAPADPVHGPYNRFVVIPGVPAGTTDLHSIAQYAGMSAIELARVDIPRSTGTITNAMITDLRTMVKPREQRILARGTLVDGSITLTGAAYQAFPQNPITGIEVPPWATHAVIRMDTTVRFVSGDGYGNVQSFLHVGTVDSTTLYSDFILDSSVGGGAYRQPFISPSDGYWPVPASLRGKKATLMTRIKGRATGTISTGTTDYYFADITFTERPS